MENSNFSESLFKEDTDDEGFSLVEEIQCGNDIGYSSDDLLKSIRFHQLPGSTVCVTDESTSNSNVAEEEALCHESNVKNGEAMRAEVKSHDESTMKIIKRLQEENEALEFKLTMANRSLANCISETKALVELKKDLETELQNKRIEAEQLKKENIILFDKIEEFEISKDKNIFKNLSDAAEIETAECETENAKLLKDANEKMNQSVEKLRIDFDKNSSTQVSENTSQIMENDIKTKEDMINELKSKLDEVHSLTEKLSPVLDEVVKERKVKEDGLKMVKQLGEKVEEMELPLKKNQQFEQENKALLETTESFVEIDSKVSESVFENFLESSYVMKKYVCLRCFKNYKSIKEVELHNGSCTSGFEAEF